METRFYETLYLAKPDLSEEDYGKLVAKVNELVDKNNGRVIKCEEWGRKTLAYRVKKFDKGYYVLLQYCAGPGTSAEIERNLRLDETVLKYQTIKLAEHVDPEELLKGAEEPSEEKTEEETGTSEETDITEKEV